MQSVGIFFLNWIKRNILIAKLSRFAEIFTFLTPAPVVSAFGRQIHYAKSS